VRNLTFACLIAAVAFIAAPAVHATPIVLDISNGCCGPGPYGTVTLTQNGPNEVDFSVLLNDPNQFVWTGQAGAFAFNVDVPGVLITVSPDSISAGFSGTVVGDGTASLHMASFGRFDYAITGDANHTNGASQPIGQLLTFSVQSIGALSFTDFDVESIAGSLHSPFAADIMNQPADQGITTGFIGTTDPPGGIAATPEPATLAISGLVLIGLGVLRRKRK